MKPVISLDGICKTYTPPWQFSFHKRGKRPVVEALTDISFSIQGGEICSLLGLNGAGKTTLVKILATLALPDRGWIEVCGFDLLANPEKVRPLIGHVNTNERSFYWRLSVEDNLEFFAALHGLNGRRRQRRIGEILELTGLEAKRSHRYDACSAGQKQRLAIGRAMLADPVVLLLDEPTSSLDVLAADRLRDFIKNNLVRDSERAVLWCTHNLQEAELVSNRVLVLHKGRLMAEYTSDQLQELIRSRGVVRFEVNGLNEGSGKVLGSFQERVLASVRKDGRRLLDMRLGEEEVPLLLEKLTQDGTKVYSCSVVQPDLEDLFTELVREAA